MSTTLPFEKSLAQLEEQLQNLLQLSRDSGLDVSHEALRIEEKIQYLREGLESRLTAWQRVQLARHPDRPYMMDYVARLFDDFEELHGDRHYKDDAAVVGGVAYLEGMPVMLVGTQKGRGLEEKIQRNFGSPYPEGYRKALRLMQMAEKFGLPIITFIDTSGAFPGVASEERHVAEAIAVNLREMSQLAVPIVAIVIGEGGSGGAIGLGVADTLIVLRNAYYSVISPEGCAAILWKDRSFAPEAAEALQLDAYKLKELGVADYVVEEPLGGAHRDPAQAAASLKTALLRYLKLLQTKPTEVLLEERYRKFRNLGIFKET